MKTRPKGVLALGWACFESAASGRTEHRPTTADYPETVVRRISFVAGGKHPWRISALATPRAKPAPWRIVVVTGAPSWAEYWAPVMAALPRDREMVVVDRPGFAASEPVDCVPSLADQAAALAPLLRAEPGQRILLVGQSYGASVAALMAADHPRQVAALALVSSYLGEPGPTARWLLALGGKFLNVIPRDLRNAVLEVVGQGEQMPLLRRAMRGLRMPAHMIHGDNDDFAPIEVARRFAAEAIAGRAMRFHAVAGGNHFLTNEPAEVLLGALEDCIPAGRPAWSPRWPAWLRLPQTVGDATPSQA